MRTSRHATCRTTRNTVSGRGEVATYSACMAILAAYEDAIRRGIPLHGIFLDIRKAYDTAERGAGKGLALARLGVVDDTIEFFMAADRRNCNYTRMAGKRCASVKGELR